MEKNNNLIKALMSLYEYADLLSDTTKAFALMKAIKSIKAAHVEVTEANCRTFAGIGPKIGSIIIEFLQKNSIEALDKYNSDESVQAMVNLTKILGVGPVTAKEWIKSGIKNLQDLVKAVSEKKISLNHMQSIGLRYYADLQTKIPRPEVTDIGICIKNIITDISKSAQVEIVGSYRRLLPTSGDIDILVTDHSPIMAPIKESIEKNPNFIDEISYGKTRYSFLWKGTKVRQVDILWVLPKSYATALLYFTGSWDFNEAIRGWAKKNNCRLNQDSLQCKVGDKYIIRNTATETDIFTHLGLLYIDPKDRSGWNSIIPI